MNKTQMIIFKNKNKKQKIEIKINNQIIKEVLNTKYLGIHIDKKLNFNKNLNELLENIKKRNNVIKIISGFTSGANPNTMLKIHKSIIQSKIDYNMNFIPTTKTNFKKVEVFQTQSLRTCLGLLKSTPNHVTISEAAMQPIKYRIKWLNGKNIIKKYALNNENFKITEKSHMEETFKNIRDILKTTQILTKNVTNNERQDIKNIMEIYDKFPTHIRNKKSTSVTELKQISLKIINNPIYNTFTKIYTDASKDDKNMGIGIYFKETNTNFNYKISEKNAIMNGELIAIVRAIKIAINKGHKKLIIFTDSK